MCGILRQMTDTGTCSLASTLSCPSYWQKPLLVCVVKPPCFLLQINTIHVLNSKLNQCVVSTHKQGFHLWIILKLITS